MTEVIKEGIKIIRIGQNNINIYHFGKIDTWEKIWKRVK